jgi:uncharacterized protein (TIGR02145 family)
MIVSGWIMKTYSSNFLISFLVTFSLTCCDGDRISLMPETRSPATSPRSAGIGSAAAAPACAETVTFTYNGAEVTYGIITSTKTGRKWMDRNLGATRRAVSHDDYQAYGDLFQWGRRADGHQLINWTAADSGTPINTTTRTRATTDVPNHNRFILNPPFPFDWRDPQNNNLWQAPAQINNPCPTGWHIPSFAEWRAEWDTSLDSTAISATGAFTRLKLTTPGLRMMNTGTLYGNAMATSYGAGGTGYYWSSTPTYTNFVDALLIYRDGPGGDVNSHSTSLRADGYSCRCIGD